MHPWVDSLGMQIGVDWQSTAKSLSADAVVGWQFVPASESVFDRRWNSLSIDEQDQARAYKRIEDHNRFVHRRGFAKEQLAVELGRLPSQIGFQSQAGGKLQLADTTAQYNRDQTTQKQLDFSLSSSGNVIAFASVWNALIGIDIEEVRPVADLPQVANTCLSEQEFEAWADLLDWQQLEAFYRIWTVKEAILKCVGLGLQLDLKQLSLPCCLTSDSGQLLFETPTSHYQVQFEILDASHFICCGSELDAVKQFSCHTPAPMLVVAVSLPS